MMRFVAGRIRMFEIVMKVFMGKTGACENVIAFLQTVRGCTLYNT